MIKKIAILLVIVLMTSTVTGFAGTYTVKYMDYAVKLKEIGVFKGSDTGFELDREPTRIEAAAMFVRLLGAEKEALSKKYKHPFSDVPEWANDYVGYLYHEKLTNGTGAATFGSSDFINAKSYMTFILRALGYNDAAGDFAWDQSLTFAKNKHLIDDEKFNDLGKSIFFRDHVANVSYLALKMTLKDSKLTLVQKLVNTNTIDKSKAEAIGLMGKEFNETVKTLGEWKMYEPFSIKNNDELGLYYGNSTFFLTHTEYSNNTIIKKLYTSTDGIEWKYIMDTNVNGQTYGIKYINGTFISFSNPYIINTSSDGITWTEKKMYRKGDQIYSYFEQFGGNVGDCAYGNGKYVAVGSVYSLRIPLILISDDLNTWEVIDLGHLVNLETEYAGLDNLTFGNNVFLANNPTFIYRTVDGRNWTKVNASADIRDIEYANGMFWAVGANTIMKSKDGITWNKIKLNIDFYANKITYGGGTFVILGDEGKILTSIDGEKWTERKLGTSRRLGDFTELLYGNGVFLSHISANLFAKNVEKPVLIRAEIAGMLSGDEIIKNLNQEKPRLEQVSTNEGLIEMEATIKEPSLDVIKRLQSYPYANEAKPKYDFKYMKVSGRAESIVRDFFVDIASFKDNETFITHRDLTYITEDYHYVIRGIVQVKSLNGLITEQDIEYEFKDGIVNNQRPGGVEYVLVAKRLLSSKSIK